eukprot:497474_1
MSCSNIVTSLKICTEVFQLQNDKQIYQEHCKCYCQSCHNSAEYGLQPESNQKYSKPIGFTRISFKRNLSSHVFKKYHKSFHGTKWIIVDKIVNESGFQLLKAGDYINPFKQLLPPKNHYQPEEIDDQKSNSGKIKRFIKWRYNPYTKKNESFDIAQTFTSPSIHYASHSCYAPEGVVTINTTTSSPVNVVCKFVLEIRQKPDEYKQTCETLGRYGSSFDKYVQNDVIEWATKRNDNVYVTGVLIKIISISKSESIHSMLNATNWMKSHDLKSECRMFKKADGNFYLRLMGTLLHSTEYKLLQLRKAYKWSDSTLVCQVKHRWGTALFSFFVDYATSCIQKIHEFNFNDNSVAEWIKKKNGFVSNTNGVKCRLNVILSELNGVWIKRNSDNAVCIIDKINYGKFTLQFACKLGHNKKYEIKDIKQSPGWSFSDCYFNMKHAWGSCTFHIIYDKTKNEYLMIEVNQNDWSECIWYKYK